MSKVKSQKFGFTLIEALIFLFIFSVITMSFYLAFVLGSNYIVDSKNRLGALSVANEKMEIIRGLPYESVGTVEGAISGEILDEEDISESSNQYHVHTVVEYVQDDFDGDAPEDNAPEDYKKVTVAVSWGQGSSQENVTLVSRFVPPGLEVERPEDGILFVNVFSDQPGGTGISGASVKIDNSETDLHTTLITNSSGSVMVMGDKVIESIHRYAITVTNGDEYERVSTMSPYPDTPYIPVDVHASVIAGLVNVINIVQNKLANLQIYSVDYLGETSIPNISFDVVGGRKLGNEADYPNNPVYNLDSNEETDSSGIKDLNSISPGQYWVSLDPLETDYELIDTDPISPFTLFSEDNLAVKLKLADKNAESLLVRIYEEIDEADIPIKGAQINLNNGADYDITQSSSDTGTVFFPTDSEAFEAGDYDLNISADGFDNYSSQVTISTNELKEEKIILTRTP